MRVMLYFMESLALISKEATALASADAAEEAGAAAAVVEAAAESSFLPQPARMTLPASMGRRIYFFIRHNYRTPPGFAQSRILALPRANIQLRLRNTRRRSGQKP